MRSILIAKGGGVFRTRSVARRASPVGEQGETEGLLRHLVGRGDLRVVYFGQYRGDPIDGLIVVQSHITGVDEMSRAADQETGFRLDEAALDAYAPYAAFINVAGYAPTMSLINNPNGAAVQCACVKYTAPMLNAIRNYRVPRIVVNNDPRSYPKDQEMTLCWPEVRPAALLDQTNREVSQVVGRKRYLRRSIWARAESWAHHTPLEDRGKGVPCTCVAHAHIKDGCKQHGRDAAFAAVLAPLRDMEVLTRMGFLVRGRGWEHFSGYDPEWMPGPVRPDEVMRVLAGAASCPAVAAAPGFYTGKPYVCIAQDCVPLLYGDGRDRYTWDPLGQFLSLDSPLRVVRPGDLRRLAREFWNERRREEHLAEWREWTRPDWTVLDRCVNDLLAGEDWTSDEWFQKYGGYR